MDSMPPGAGAENSLQAEPPEDKRTQPDRRKQPTSPWGALPPAGHRTRNRRADEHRRPYFVDRFPPALLAFLLMLLIASLVDAVLTIRLIESGGGEINPVMNRLLEHGVLPFLLGKYLLTVIGLPADRTQPTRPSLVPLPFGRMAW